MNELVEQAKKRRDKLIQTGDLTESQWFALEQVFPGARPESKLMAWEYCKVRQLDPFKKVVHIMPMRVQDSETKEWRYRDVIMPGISELRITAFRTGQYVGMDRPEYGAPKKYLGILAPEYVEVTVWRTMRIGPMIEKCSFPGRADFSEVAGTKKNHKTGVIELNSMWTSKPRMMLVKVAEADALRRAFPEELGGEYGYEEYTDGVEHEPQPRKKTRSRKKITPDQPVEESEERQNWSMQTQANTFKQQEKHSEEKWPAVGTQNRAEDTPVPTEAQASYEFQKPLETEPAKPDKDVQKDFVAEMEKTEK